MAGYAVDTASLAARVGELNAVADSVDGVVSTLDAAGCDLGPGDISSAVAEVVERWRANLGGMRDKIGEIADNVRGAADNYESVERTSRDAMAAHADSTVAEQVVRGLEQAVPRRTP
ncbi:WXG100 family type VII secretion target [Actinokineospora pegani]|uniref:WXG100 family type VII secretion target n=1 Tax=Actinokineospora pegani TaxID=2654637 RepID=UPI0012EA5A40|nr:type VII secretion target [Actinokineospora pegani]